MKAHRPLEPIHARILLYLIKHPMSRRRDIAAAVGLTPEMLWTRINTLESLGLIYRQPSQLASHVRFAVDADQVRALMFPKTRKGTKRPLAANQGLDLFAQQD